MNVLHYFALFSAFLLQLSSSSNSLTKPNAIYSIVASGKLVPNADYYVTLTANNVTQPGNVLVKLTGTQSNNQTVSAEGQATVSGNVSQVFTLKIGDWKDGDYKLKVTGTGGLNFTHESTVFMENENTLVFIQTDKAIYKPGQKVKFRLIAVNQNLVPLVGTKVNTVVKDASGNIIQKYDEVSPKHGVLSHEIQLSDQPVLGDWSIRVANKHGDFVKTFTIAEYVLPTFDVDVILPGFATVNTTSIPVTVKATYTYGKPVKGHVVISVSDSFYSYFRRGYTKRKRVEFTADLKGEITIPVEIKDFVNSNDFYNSKQYDVDASVKDGLTGKVYNKTNKLTVYEKRYKFDFLQNSKKYKVGLKYVTYIRVSYPDGTPVENEEAPLKITYGFGYKNDKSRETTARIVNGLAKVVLDTSEFPKSPTVVNSTVNGAKKTVFLPDETDTSSIKVEADYKGVKELVGYLYKSSTSDQCYLQLQVADDQVNKHFKVGDELLLELESTKPIHEFVYHVVGKKGVLFSKVEKGDGSLLHPFRIVLAENAAPKIRVVVHYLCEGSVIVSTADFDVDGALKTKINVTTNVAETKPGSSISLNIKTEPHSTVGLLGIDQKTLLLKSGNDLEKKDLMDGVQRYMGCRGERDFHSCSPATGHYWDGDQTPWDFRSAGLLMFSNQQLYQKVHLKSRPAVAYDAPEQAAFVGSAAAGPPPPSFRPMAVNSVTRTSLKRNKEGIKVRKFFPETWIWETVEVNETGTASVPAKMPDTITSWLVSGFAVNHQTGLGLTEDKTKINVFRPFFVKFTLPYSVIRGETVAIEVTVYNYMKDPQTTKVTLENEKDEYEFVKATSDSNDVLTSGKNKIRDLIVPANDGVTTTFLIKPKKLGYIELRISAISDTAGDKVVDKLLVKPEGKTSYLNKAMLVSLGKEKTSFSEVVKIDIPENAVADSERVTVSAIGDVLGPAINNLDNLLRVPYGCGEQNMINFVPNIVVLNYLSKAQRLTPKAKDKALSNIETGYQRELTYKHNDGSYSAFGKADTNGSTWLTAFVIKSFFQAKPYYSIDDKVIEEGLQFLVRRQRDDGSFAEYGRVLSSYMQGGTSAKSGSLTAYVLIALLSDPTVKAKYEKSITKAEEYLSKRLEETSDVYEIAITTYALHLSGSSNKEKGLSKLTAQAQKNGQEFVFWKKNGTYGDYGAVEMSSYALMSYINRGETNEALPIVRWLVSKQNSLGGFSSTQDTVIGLQALGSFAEKVSSEASSLEVAVQVDSAEAKSIKIQPDNAIVLQKILLDKKSKTVKIDAKGSGAAIVQVSWQFNTLNVSSAPAFALNYTLTHQDKSSLKLDVCASYTAGTEAGMTLLEVTLPSGYTVDEESLNSIENDIIKRVDTKEGKTVAVIYFDKVTGKPVCAPVSANRDVQLANLKPVPITIYDYYDTSKSATILYSPPVSKTCDICSDDDCDASCKA